MILKIRKIARFAGDPATAKDLRSRGAHSEELMRAVAPREHFLATTSSNEESLKKYSSTAAR
jgi:hypothetical protein